MTSDVSLRVLTTRDTAFPKLARLRHDAFFARHGDALADTQAALADLLDQSDGHETGFIAEIAGNAIGMVLFVRHEIEQKHDHTPWLASLIVTPEARGSGIGTLLVWRVEHHAKLMGHDQIWLYTNVAEDFYTRLGWIVEDSFDWDGDPFILMRRDLPADDIDGEIE